MPRGELFQYSADPDYRSMIAPPKYRYVKNMSYCYLFLFTLCMLYLVYLMYEQTLQLAHIMYQIKTSTLNQTSCVLSQVCHTIGKEICGVCF